MFVNVASDVSEASYYVAIGTVEVGESFGWELDQAVEYVLSLAFDLFSVLSLTAIFKY